MRYCQNRYYQKSTPKDPQGRKAAEVNTIGTEKSIQRDNSEIAPNLEKAMATQRQEALATTETRIREELSLTVQRSKKDHAVEGQSLMPSASPASV